MFSNKTKIFTIFTSPGYGGAGNPPSKLLTNNELLKILEDNVKI